MAVVQVSSLHSAVDAVVKQPGIRRSLLARSIRVRDAAALVELVALQDGHQAGGQPWIVANRKPVLMMIRAGSVLILLEESILPSLEIQPTHLLLLAALLRYAGDLRTFAAAAGGSFRREVASFTVQICAFVDDAVALPAYSPFGKLCATAASLRHHAKRLLDSTCTLSQSRQDDDDEEEAAAAVANEEDAGEAATSEKPSGTDTADDGLALFSTGAHARLLQFFGLMAYGDAGFGTGIPARGWWVSEDNDAMQVKVVMPGLDKEHVKVSVESNILVIKGEGNRVAENCKRPALYSRYFQLPAEAFKMEQTKAQMNNGLLKVTFLKIKPEEREDQIDQ